MNNSNHSSRGRLAGYYVAGLLVPLAACGGSSSSDSTTFFTAISTKQACAASSQLVVEGKRFVFQADESTSQTDFNGDGDQVDSVAVVVDMSSEKQTVLNVAADELAVVSNLVYLGVDESKDGFDWNQDADSSDYVLLVYPKQDQAAITSPNATNVEYVDDLETVGSVHLIEVDKRLYYTRPDTLAAALVVGQSTLAWVDSATPTAPTEVPVTAVPVARVAAPRILGVSNDLIFLYEDESVVGPADLNTDTDTTDALVLALLDGKDVAASMQTTGLAILDDTIPFDAKSTASDDWVAAFLVSEAGQSDFLTGLNDQTDANNGFGASWEPLNCPAYVDTDTTDNILFFLQFKLWFANPTTVADEPKNTGVPGTQRVVATSNAVATITLEVDDGGCDLNDNTESDDRIVRWVRISSPKVPFGDPDELVAVTDTPGGSFGLTTLDDNLIAVVDESNEDVDHDGSVADHDLIAWLDPAQGAGAQWTYDHSSTATIFFDTTWLGRDAVSGLIFLAFSESFLNNGMDVNGDGDQTDAIPSTARFGTATDLDFFWPGLATIPDNAGLSFFNDVLFFRVDEATDEFDWDGDGNMNDVLLGRSAFTFQNFAVISDDNDIPDVSSADGGGNIGVGWIAEEKGENDFNKDGDQNDFVVRWCRIGS